MAIPTTYPVTRYLDAKKSVDDRALNRRVLQNFTGLLWDMAPERPIQILEIGAGIGTMVERLLDWGALKQATYTAIDRDPNAVSEGYHRLPRWAASSGYDVTRKSPREILLKRGDQEFLVAFEATELYDFALREKGHRSWNVLIANAFLDLVDVPSTLPYILSLLRPGGLTYFTINYDGVTVLEPEIDPTLDARITTLYDKTMDERVVSGKPSGDSRTGRHLFANFMECGVDLLDAGSSDWIVFGGPQGYPEDEAFFLHYLIHTISTALRGHPEIDASLLAAWIRDRHSQVEQGKLVYIAHQLDFLGRLEAPPSQ
jgi:hypothetical protein